MVKKKDYYEVLGIGKNASDQEIKKAYRKAARNCHPDSNSSDPHAEEKFKEITEAYEILSDPEKKKLYDQYGPMAFDGTGHAREEAGTWGQGFGGGRHYSWSSHDHDEDIEDLLRHMFGERPFHQRRRKPRKGPDSLASIEISLKEAVLGCRKLVELRDQGTLQVSIPPGMESGQRIRLKGKGEPVSGMPPGDLYVVIHVRKDPIFWREGNDLYTKIRIPYATAVLGGEVTVSTLEGKVSCKIKEGTRPGTRIRLKGKGVIDRKNPPDKGDFYAVVDIAVPTGLSEEARKKLAEFQELV